MLGEMSLQLKSYYGWPKLETTDTPKHETYHTGF